jgi:tetratricopeptide (TPR) repeat protein
MNATSKPRRGSRRPILRAMMLLLILAGGLALAEFMLWGWHYGRPTGFLEPLHTKGAQRYSENIHFHRAYQSGIWPTPEDPFIDLVMPKPPGTFRIFLFGGSAAMGYPPGSASGLPRMLEVQLEAAFDGMRFEVHNGAFPGMNSHAIREAARECAAYAPDLFIVYTGLEEVFGAHDLLTGGDSFFDRPGWVPWRVWLKRRQLTQLVAQLRGTDAAPGAPTPVVLELPATDAPAWGLMAQTLEDNLAAVARAAEVAGAGVLLCTVPFEAASGESPPYARVLAATNEAVRRMAGQHDGVTLVDLAEVLSGAPAGDSNFYDGVHPRTPAIHRMAANLAEETGKQLGRDFIPEKRLTLEQAQAALGITPAVAQMHLVTMRRAITELGPVQGLDVTGTAGRLDAGIAALDREAGLSAADLTAQLQAALQARPNDYFLNRQLAEALHAQGNTAGARDVLEGLIQRYPGRAALHGDMALLHRSEENHAAALGALRAGLAADRWNAEVYWLLGMTLLDVQPAEAAPSFARGLALLPRGPEIPGSLDALRERLEAGLEKARQAAGEPS